jgi:Glycosyl hydrolase family 99
MRSKAFVKEYISVFRTFRTFGLLIIAITFFGCSKNALSNKPTPIVVTKTPDTPVTVTGAKPVVKTNSQKVFVHYMAWFETPATSGNGKWGQHWTMANEDPTITLGNGRQQIASWFYPMIGPYASSDRDVIDYHLLLMKYAGIDGLIVDWYGVQNVNDYPLIKRNTDSLFKRVPYAGLQYGICYEDATLTQDKAVAGTDSITAAQQDFAYLQSNYFNSGSYIKINNQPLLLDFGPQVLKTSNDWSQAFSQLSTKPRLLSLEYAGSVTGSSGSGEFAWVDATDQTNLSGFYQGRAPSLATYFAAAYPGFQDFYAQGGWGNTLFLINYNNTATLQNCLSLAKTSGTNYLQLITWNDYGEGTMIEPTLDFNFTFLQAIQQYTGVSYTVTELQLIYKWYTLRKKYVGNSTVETQLTQAYNYLVGLDVTDAAAIISGIN